MTIDPKQKVQLDDALIEALLTAAYQTDLRDDEDRIAGLIQRVDGDTRPVTSKAQVWYRRRSWISLTATAALILVGIFLFNPYSANNVAYAEVIRSLKANAPNRLYLVKMLHQSPLWGEREVASELYLDDQDRFVIKHPGWTGLGPIWIGGNPNERWLVPARGPALLGGEPIVGRWLAKKDIPSPYLHLTTILHRMSQAYHLEMLDDESIQLTDGESAFVVCKHIRGSILKPKANLPTTIELWANSETGIAQRVILVWDRKSGERGPLRWELNLEKFPELPEDWFVPQGHIRANRAIIKIQSDVELDVLEPTKDESPE